MMNIEALRQLTAAHGQQHVLRYFDRLDDAGRRQLAGQLAAIDFDELDELIRDYVLVRPQTAIPGDLAPAPFFPLEPAGAAQAELYRRARERGAELLRQGRVALLTVAGGQGTRLGFDGPKGTYPIGPVTGRSLFAYFAQGIARAGEKYGRDFTWHIMTSVLNDAATREYFQSNAWFGLRPEQVVFFTQGTMPAIGYDGKLLLEAEDSLALSPDGHGGTLLALRRSGALDRMRAEGNDYISYFQVDNPLVPVVDELFLGLTDLEHSEMSAIMLAKTGPFEKLGNFCVADGRTEIIEYSDLPDALAESRNADGSLRFIAGSPAIHVIARGFVERLTAGGRLSLGWHRADKKVPCLDGDGNRVKPEESNAVKLESFIFDAMPLAQRTMILEGSRRDLFGPTKNPTGVDSVESCRELLIARDLRRLAAAGVEVPAGVKVEVSPRRVLDAADMAEYCRARHLTTLAGRGGAVVLE